MPVLRALFQQRVTQRDVAQREAAVPEQDGFVVALTAGLQAGDDLAQFGVQRLLAELAGFDMGAQGAELASFALAPIVHHHLGHDVGERQLDRAHGAVGHDERALLDPVGLEQRLGLHQARGFDHDVGALDRVFPVVEGAHGLAEIARQLGGEFVAALLAARVHADLVEPEQLVEQAHVPIGGAARADVAEHLAALAREVLGAERGDGAGAHLGDAGGIEHRLGHAGPGIEQVEDRHLRRQAVLIVVDIVADDLDAREVDRCADRAPQHVEMAVRLGIGDEVHARLDHRGAAALRGEAGFDRG